ncbi:FT-interacting protein 7 [Impatiens glandulifera]|uniref:FT-interacting protein 7 n=1 Tax=Impatiens glandulifera TaxID=253017 RepID=UPI001FB0B1C0|nr:FT-interacting protein 7 [Impatiens glandulifera]
MAAGSVRKLFVEVCNAKNLMPKDGLGTASAYAIADFDGQRKRSKTIVRDLNPEWNEKLEFFVHDTDSMASEVLEVNLYNDKKTVKRSTFLGKVKIAGNMFAKSGSEALIYYPLEKRSVFSQIKGEIGLKVWFVDEIIPPPPPAEDGKTTEVEKKVEEKPPEKEEEKKADEKTEAKNDDESKNKDDKPNPSEEVKKEENPKPAENPKTEEAPPPATPPPPPPQPDDTDNRKQQDKIITPRKQTDLSANDRELRSFTGDRNRGSYDLVDPMPFLFVRVMKVKRTNPEADSSQYAKLVIGTHSIKTKTQLQGKDWDQVFAFNKEVLNSTSLEVSVWSEKKGEDGNPIETSLGTVSFDLLEIPKRVPPDSPLAPQWYTMDGLPENSPASDIMLAVWIGTQADESFQEAWQSDSGGLIPETRAKVYLSPKLWYLRVTVIQTQDLRLGSGQSEPKVKNPDLYVKAQLGSQLFKTGRTTIGSSSSSSNPTWNEDLVFVAAEPFEPYLMITVEDLSNGRSIGQSKIHVASIDRITDDKSEPRSRWFNLIGDENTPYAGRIHVRVCLEGGYHVLDEVPHFTSDVRPAAKELSKPPIGLLELGIRGATNLLPVKTRDGSHGTTDAYVVAKYGPKWVRTRTILDRFNPRWNEQYTWDVYDPCTVLTIGVFDNGRYESAEMKKSGKDLRIGKLRLRLSTLETNRAYVGSYSLMVLLPGGVKKMGEIEIAVRFTCSSWLSLIQAYHTPMLPRMHYVNPLGPAQQDILRHTAMRIVMVRMARSEPALGQEVVQHMLDSDTHIWSMRRSKANWFRVVGCLCKVASLAKWVDGIRKWIHPPTTILMHILLLAIVLFPDLILPTVFMYAFLILALRFRYRQRISLAVDTRLSCLDMVGIDDLDEELDGFPTVRSPEQIRVRYDRLRAIGGRVQTLLGDVAAQGERLEGLFSWKDPRATGIFVVVCLLASLMFYAVPFKVVVLGFGFYLLRHPRFRGDMPSIPVNFFRRLPSLSDQIL